MALLGKQLLILWTLVVLRESVFPSSRGAGCPKIALWLQRTWEQRLPCVQESFPDSCCALDP